MEMVSGRVLLYLVACSFAPAKGKPLNGKPHLSQGQLSRLRYKHDTKFEARYGPNSETANRVKKLISMGASILGKTRMSAFASAEEFTDQFVDFHAHFNPWGDGYQTPAGSSSGSAAALWIYGWLDIAINTDTSGSTR